MNLHVSLQRETDDLLRQRNLYLRIGDHLVDVGALRVETAAGSPRLTGKAMAVLIELVRGAGTTVTRDELLDRVWKGRCTTPDVLTQAIKELRRAFGDDRPARYIETIPKVGYRLLARVLVVERPPNGVFVEAGEVTLEDAFDAQPQAANEEAPQAATAPAARAPSRAWLAALVAAAVLAALAYTLSRDDGARMQAARVQAPAWQVEEVRALTSEPGAERRPRLSPDGTRIAFGVLDEETGFDRIVVRTLAPSQRVHVTPGRNQHEVQPAWSPDGMHIAFERLLRTGCTMHVASSLGGGEREVGTCADFRANYYDWTPDGRHLVLSGRSGGGGQALKFLSLQDGSERFLPYERAPDDQDLDPHFSPDGTRIAFRRGFSPYSDLYVVDADGGTPRRLTHVAARIRGHGWTRDGSALVFSSNHAGPMALHVVDVESGVIEPLGVSPAEYPATSVANDAVAYEFPRDHSMLARIDLDEQATAQPLALSTGNDYTPELSPDGKQVAFTSDRSGRYQIWLHDLGTGQTRALTEDARRSVKSPQWSPDGTRMLALERDASGRRAIEFEIATLHRRELTDARDNVLAAGYGPEQGSWLFLVGNSASDNELLLVRDARGEGESRETIVRGINAFQLDRETGAIWYTPTVQNGLYRLDRGAAAPVRVTDRITSLTGGWRLVDGRIWYVADIEVESANLHAFDPATGEDHVLHALHAIVRNLEFDVAPDRKSLYLAPFKSEDADIGLLRLTRTGGH